jgi:hypothetical protein
MPNVSRNMLSPSSGAEVTRQEIKGLHMGTEEQGLREGRKYVSGMQTHRDPSGRLRGGGWHRPTNPHSFKSQKFNNQMIIAVKA